MFMVENAPVSALPALSFFGDASSRDSKFMVAGGIAVAGNRLSEIEDQIAFLREDAGITSEFHWSEYRGGRKRAAYEALIQYGFDLINKRKAALHIIVAQFQGYNHRKNVGDSKDTSINRMYFQLFLHRVTRFYGAKRAIHIRLDAGNDCKDICNMRNQLCAKAYTTYSTQPNCVRSIEPVNSAHVGLVQLVDVIIGAVAAKQNELSHTSPKGALADFVLQASGRKTWATDTPSSARFLTVWHHQSLVSSRSPETLAPGD